MPKLTDLKTSIEKFNRPIDKGNDKGYDPLKELIAVLVQTNMSIQQLADNQAKMLGELKIEPQFNVQVDPLDLAPIKEAIESLGNKEKKDVKIEFERDSEGRIIRAKNA